MELPGDVLRIIRDYAKPCTRPDWKTCKLTEANSIKMLLYESNYRCVYLFPCTMIQLCNEIATWSLYGKIRLLEIMRSRRLWLPVATQEWYEVTLRHYLD